MTVVLDAGLGMSSLCWHWIGEPRMRKHTRVSTHQLGTQILLLAVQRPAWADKGERRQRRQWQKKRVW